MTSCPVTHRSHLWLWVCPAGSHGANNASRGIHVKVPPGQDDLGPTARLSHKLGGVGLECAAYWLTEIHTWREGQSTEGWRARCEKLLLRGKTILKNLVLAFIPEHGTERTQWGEAVRRHLAQLDVTH